MNKHEKLPEWIDRFNNNDLHGKELREFLDLMKQNPELRCEVKLDKELNGVLADTDIIELRKKIVKYKIPEKSNPMLLPILFLAASITILIGLAFFVYLWMKQSDEKIMNTDYTYFLSDTSIFRRNQITAEEQVAIDGATLDSSANHRKQTDIKTNDEILLTANYEPYLPYESMVGEVNRAFNFKLLKPSGSVSFRQGTVITFGWETESFASLTITIADNKGQSIFVSQPITGKEFLLETSEFSKGLYYFKFIDKEEIIYFGKFTLQ